MKVKEIFCSFQGEGVRCGTLNVFVRFSGCNLRCDFARSDKSPGGFACDTDFTGGMDYSTGELLAKMAEVGAGCKAVIFTGGEPMLQLTPEFLRACKEAGWYTAVETNGTVLPEGLTRDLLDWITVSPKTAEHTLTIKNIGKVDEVKYVFPENTALPRPAVEADAYLLSPVFHPDGLDVRSLEWCQKVIHLNPSWRLSVQFHKFLRHR